MNKGRLAAALIATVIVVVAWVDWLGDASTESRGRELSPVIAEITDSRVVARPRATQATDGEEAASATEPTPLVVDRQVGRLRVLVVDDLGEAVSGVYVLAGTSAPPLVHHAGRTGNDGWVELLCAPGSYGVSVNDGQPNGTHGSAVIMDVLMDRDVKEILAVINRQSAGVHLRARDGNGQPVVGILVAASGPAGAVDPSPQRTNELGDVNWAGLSPGRWRFRPQSDDPTLDLHSTPKKTVTLVADEVTSAEWSFQRLGQVIVDLTTVPFLSGLDSLTLDGDIRSPPWPTELRWTLPAGEYCMVPIWSPESECFSSQVEFYLSEGEVLRVPLSVEVGAISLSGRVLTSIRAPVEGALIKAFVQRPDPLQPARNWIIRKSISTDASGMWSLRGLPLGELSIMAYCDRTVDHYLDQIVRISDGVIPEASHVDFGDTLILPATRATFELTGAWQARVTEGSGVTVELLRIHPPPLWEGRQRTVTVVEPGVYAIENVVPGDYVVRLVDRTRREILESVALTLPNSAGEGHVVKFRLGEGKPELLSWN